VLTDGSVQTADERRDLLGERCATAPELGELERRRVQQTVQSIDAVGELVSDGGRPTGHRRHRVAHTGHLERGGHRRPGTITGGGRRLDPGHNSLERSRRRDDGRHVEQDLVEGVG